MPTPDGIMDADWISSLIWAVITAGLVIFGLRASATFERMNPRKYVVRALVKDATVYFHRMMELQRSNDHDSLAGRMELAAGMIPVMSARLNASLDLFPVQHRSVIIHAVAELTIAHVTLTRDLEELKKAGATRLPDKQLPNGERQSAVQFYVGPLRSLGRIERSYAGSETLHGRLAEAFGVADRPGAPSSQEPGLFG